MYSQTVIMVLLFAFVGLGIIGICELFKAVFEDLTASLRLKRRIRRYLAKSC